MSNNQKANVGMTKLFSRLVLTCMVIATISTPVGAGIITPVNNGFESPDLSGWFGYGSPDATGLGLPGLPSGAGLGWTFAGTTGIASNFSLFNIFYTAGNQAGFIQSYSDDPFNFESNTISQTLDGFQKGFASVTFAIESRSGYGGVPILVKLDDQVLGTYTALSAYYFTDIHTPFVPVTAGSHTLSFTALNMPGDHASFIDSVTVNNVVPEHSSLTLAGIGGLTLALVAYRRRSAV
jgi:hypothetical protein